MHRWIRPQQVESADVPARKALEAVEHGMDSGNALNRERWLSDGGVIGVTNVSQSPAVSYLIVGPV